MSAAVPASLDLATRIRYSITDSLLVARRNLVQLRRVPTVFVFELVQPVMFTLLFRYVFGGAIAGLPPGVDYVLFLMPGIFMQNAIFGSTTTALGIADDLKKGLVDRFRSLPMARAALLAGRTTADLGKNFILVVVMIGVGYLVDFRFENGLPGAIGVVALACAVGFAFSWISATIGLAVKEFEAVQAVTFTWIFPVVFVAHVFVPPGTMPAALEWFARNNPVTHWANLARVFTIGQFQGSGGSTTELILISAAWIAGILAVFIPLSIRLYRKLT
jgi:ABC-2 type transport system permease protein/oleandomycin transport system permease protein